MAAEIAQFGSVLEIASFGVAEETAEFGVLSSRITDIIDAGLISNDIITNSIIS